MSEFNRAIKYVLKHEGGLVNDPADPGGLTNRGITKRDYPHLDIVNLTEAETIEIYRRDYWRPVYDEMTDKDAACKVFDMAVNMGHSRAHKLLQRAVGALDDGVFGPATLAAANACHNLTERLCKQQADFYRLLASRRPALNKFLRGWLRRAEWRP